MSTTVSTGSRPSSGGHWPGLATDSARFPPAAAGRAIPVLAAALERAQRFATLGADRRRNVLGPGLAQRDKQIRDGTRRRGTAIVEHGRLVEQSLGQPSSFGPASGHTF